MNKLTSTKALVWTMVAMIIIAALYRIIPGRPWGFAPQIAIALFGGALIKDKKWAFALPVFSMFLSDLLYQGLYNAGLSPIYGFYGGQWVNYCEVALMVFVGFAIKKINLVNVLVASLVAPTLFFLLSNFTTWSGLAGQLRGLNRPFTFQGLLMAYTDGLLFYKGSLEGTLFFSAVFFGGYYLLSKNNMTAVKAVHA